jgi:ABC-type multidrug transport system ATPase subunit
MAEVEDLCATITVIDRGRVLFSGAVEALRMLAPAAVHALRTSDDCAAFRLASERAGVRVARAADGSLEVSADSDALDAFVIALGGSGIAVRALESRVRSLESLFLELTASVVS